MSKSISWMRNKAVMVGSAAILTAAMLALPGMGVVKAATPVNATVTIKTAVMDGGTLVNAQAVTVNKDNPTLKDAIEAAEVATGVDVDIAQTQYGYYVKAVEVDGHSSTNKFFDDNGTASYDAISPDNADYAFKSQVDDITAPAFIGNHFWTNTVATTNYLTEKDYNYNSGWMVELNNDNYANWGIDTTLNEGDNIELDFTMFGGADLGGTAYVLADTATSPSSGPWVAVSPF